jgi:hypothetical protein
MVKAGRTIGRALRKVITSPTWQAVQQTSRDLRNLPNKLIRDAGLEDDVKGLEESLKLKDLEEDLKKAQSGINSGLSSDLSAWTTTPENTIAPPEPQEKPQEIAEPVAGQAPPEEIADMENNPAISSEEQDEATPSAQNPNQESDSSKNA